MKNNLHKILYIEDDEIDRNNFKRYAKRSDFPHEIEYVVDFENAKKYLDNNQVDIILSDHNLGDGDIFDVISLSKGKKIPVVAVTGQGNESVAVEAIQSGAHHYIVKDDQLNYLSLVLPAIESALENARLKEEVDRAQQALQSYTFMVSHDLNAPISTLISYADLLLERDEIKNNQELFETTQNISSVANQAMAMVKVTLQYGQVGSANQPKSEFKIDSLMSDITKALAGLIDEAGVEVSIDATHEIESDKLAVARVIQNLMHNAIKYGKKQGLKIAVKSRQEDNKIFIDVTDNGQGIHEDNHAKIFQPYYQIGKAEASESVDAQAQKSWGLGLPMCKRVMNLLGGDILVESAPGEGSTFSLVFPNANRKGDKKS